MTAPGIGAMCGASARASRVLPVPDRPPTAMNFGGGAALAQTRHDAVVVGAAFFGERCDVRGRKNLPVLGKRLNMLVDVGAQRFDPGLGVDDRRLVVRGGDGTAERIGQIVVDLIGEMI